MIRIIVSTRSNSDELFHDIVDLLKDHVPTALSVGTTELTAVDIESIVHLESADYLDPDIHIGIMVPWQFALWTAQLRRHLETDAAKLQNNLEWSLYERTKWRRSLDVGVSTLDNRPWRLGRLLPISTYAPSAWKNGTPVPVLVGGDYDDDGPQPDSTQE